MLLPSLLTASLLLDYLDRYSPNRYFGPIYQLYSPQSTHDSTTPSLYAVVYPKANFAVAKAFWQHTGEGISSRRAAQFLKAWELGEVVANQVDPIKVGTRPRPRSVINPVGNDPKDQNGRNVVPVTLQEEMRVAGDAAKRVIKEMIAGLVSHGVGDVGQIDTADVYLFPCGMSAMFNTHRALLEAIPGHDFDGQTVSFGFPYVDTLKILQKFNQSGCLFYGHGTVEDLDHLERHLESGTRIRGLFIETPSNPLLRSPDLIRMNSLARKYGFAIIVDETIGNFVNVDVLGWADVIFTSLTKAWSGECNVMGGSVVFNPKGPHYTALKQAMESQYEDNWYWEDAVVMERNCRNFVFRVQRMNANAEALCDLLSAHPRVREVYYPKISTTNHFYEAFRRPGGGYGFLLSFYFHDPTDCTVFLDAVDTLKGPSLGTNFTLTSPYTILAHYGEQEWAEGFGVDIRLMRVSVGIEERALLLHKFGEALKAVDRDAERRQLDNNIVAGETVGIDGVL